MVTDENGVHHGVKMVPAAYNGPVNVTDADDKDRAIDSQSIYLVDVVFGKLLKLFKSSFKLKT